MIGTTISHFRILDLLGKGGMGEVYRAEDTTLNRQVAIKVLPELLAHDPERLARFEREAKLLATLNHPNIATIYGLEEADGKRLLILELVEGETLAERIAEGLIPIEEALHLALQITEGLEAAHEKGIIHRDLKPGNIKLTPEGKVKILDFGLAKAFEYETHPTDASQSPTLTDQMTHAGVILGTAAYMSPEQAKGKAVDKRADIWAFGAVLFEMLAGKRAFEGETITETLASILKGDPDWQALPENTSWRIKELLSDCLQKNLADRLHDTADVRIQIKKALNQPEITTRAGVVDIMPPTRWTKVLPWSLVVLMAGIAGIAVWSSTPPTPLPTARFPLRLPEGQHFSYTGRHVVAISPNSKHLVYTANNQLYLRALDQLEATPMRGTEGGARDPFFSPDGQWVGFWNGGRLRKVSITGGSPVTLCESQNTWGADWGSEGTILFGQGSGGIWRVPATGGTPEVFISLDPGEIAYGPQTLPDGGAVLFTLATSGVFWDQSQIVVQSLGTGERKVLIEGGRDGRYVSTGHLIYAQSGTLLAVPFDLTRLELTGGPVPIVEDVRPGSVTPAMHFAFSELGTFAYVPGASDMAENSLVWVDRKGTESAATEEKRDFTHPRVSPEGDRIALAFYEDEVNRNIWIYDIERASYSRLTFEGSDNSPLIWTPDGKSITFQSNREGPNNIYQKLADGSGTAERLTTGPNPQIPTSWSPDGSVLLFHENIESSDILFLPMEGNREPQLLISSPSRECCARFSPDGRWLAYVSDETGQPHVYVSPYPNPEVKWLASGQEGGGAPVWSPDGTELFYQNGAKMMVVSVKTEPTLTTGRPQELFEGSFRISTTNPGFSQYYDISPDGQSFLMIREEEQQEAQINVVLNWFEELKRLVPTD